MDPFLMIEWVGAYVVVADPPRVGLAWRLEELESTTEDPEEVESDREVYDKGWRWCVCYSAREPSGEKGFIPYDRLMPLSTMELEAARAALEHGPHVFERALDALLESSARRLI
jgi:hypothetical protein